jgi:uncharacterized phage protein (TIGR01671 family)
MQKVKFRAWSKQYKKLVYFDFSDIVDERVIFGNDHTLNVMENEVEQFTGLTDKNGVEIYSGDVVKFWICYETSQTHTGDNIPGGSYTEPDEPQLIEIKGQVYYNEDICGFDWSLIGERPYQMDNAFQWLTQQRQIPIIGRDEYQSEEIKYIIGWENISDKEYIELLNDYGFDSEEDLMSKINTIEVIGNIHQDKHLLD